MSNPKLNQEFFIKRCIETHGDKFDYTEIVYVNAITKITIKCNTCSHTWNTIPGNFTHNKTGCPNCKILRHRKRMSEEWIPRNEFISYCTEIHNNKYDYSCTIYPPSNKGGKILIVCPEHGKFEQRYGDHRKGIGCNKCRVSRILDTKISKGMICDTSDVTIYENYCNKVWYATEKNFKEFKNVVNPNNLTRSINGNHLDHIFSVQQGFYNNIPPHIIGHYTNLRLISAFNNRTKYIKCDKSIQQLYEDYNSTLMDKN